LKTVFLTIGPRGAGKSTFCKKMMEAFPQITCISRDQIMLEMYGTIYGGIYTSEFYYAIKKMFERVAEHLCKQKQPLILDYWNGSTEERERTIQKLRKLGSERIIGLYFTTPENICLSWLTSRCKKEVKKKILITEPSEHALRKDYQLFHSDPIDPSLGFDYIIKIDASIDGYGDTFTQIKNILENQNKLSVTKADIQTIAELLNQADLLSLETEMINYEDTSFILTVEEFAEIIEEELLPVAKTKHLSLYNLMCRYSNGGVEDEFDPNIYDDWAPDQDTAYHDMRSALRCVDNNDLPPSTFQKL
jgi:predicted kinase